MSALDRFVEACLRATNGDRDAAVRLAMLEIRSAAARRALTIAERYLTAATRTLDERDAPEA